MSFSWKLAADVALEQRIYVHISSYTCCTYVGTSPGKREVSKDQWMDRTMDETKEGQMEVRWLLTNRKHGGKTKSVSVLKAALKNGGMEGEKNRKDDC